MMLPAVACVAGIYLGLHFSLTSLLPFSALGAGIYLVLGLSAGHSLPDGVWNLSIVIITLQVSYVLGLISRDAYRQVVDRLGLVQSQRR
jgi:hypothetical protein